MAHAHDIMMTGRIVFYHFLCSRLQHHLSSARRVAFPRLHLPLTSSFLHPQWAPRNIPLQRMCVLI